MCPPLPQMQLAQFTSQIFSTVEDAEQVTPLQNNFRHVHPTFSRVVSMSRDARPLPLSSAPPPGAPLLLVALLGGFVSGF